jgi:uncharacterized protein (DUF488 family)
MSAMTLWTVGHSTRAIAELIALLGAHDVDTVVDVRTVPRSRRNPQFEKAALTESLPRAAIAYTHMPGLGGLRKPIAGSKNTGLTSGGFRGYADYMQTGDFGRHLVALVKMAVGRRVALMCAEALPAQCHRSLLSDALVVHGVDVLHITGDGGTAPHVLTPWARREGTRLTYPPSQGELL